MLTCGSVCLREVRRYCQLNKLDIRLLSTVKIDARKTLKIQKRLLNSLPSSKTLINSLQQRSLISLPGQRDTAVIKEEKRLSVYVKDTNIGREYGLNESQLQGIKWKRLRTGYEGEKENFPDQQFASKIYLRSDVVRRAMDIYKTQLHINYQKKKFDKPEREEEDFGDAVTNLLTMLRTEDKVLKNSEAGRTGEKAHKKMLRSQMAAPLTAVGVSLGTNFAVFLLKLGAYKMTGSASMLGECIHSLVDCVNQLLLGYGLIYSMKRPHSDHPYGFTKARYIYALISGVSIFNMGAAVTVYHGVQQLYNPSLVLDHSIGLAFTLLLVSGMIEGYSLHVAAKKAKFLAKVEGVSLYDYVIHGNEPNTSAILAEDCAAVGGIFIAGTALGLSIYTGNPMYDAIGSIGVGAVLGGMALFIIAKNVDNLVGKSMSPAKQKQVVDMLEQDPAVLSVVDVKTIVEGPGFVRFKAEVLFNSDEIARNYLNTVTHASLLKQAQNLESEIGLEHFIEDQSKLLIDTLAIEVDRIEYKIKRHFPEIRHVDLELL